MDGTWIKKILDDVAGGGLTVAAAMEKLAGIPIEHLDVALHDTHRPLRNGFSEVIFCEGKRPEHVVEIVRKCVAKGMNVFGTRADEGLCAQIRSIDGGIEWDDVSRTFMFLKTPPPQLGGELSIVCAGTADMAVAEVARKTAFYFGVEAKKYYDVGVAGIHRLFNSIDEIRKSDVVIAVAGMEGALPSVLGGLIAAPIISVPSSVGYGTGKGGMAALFAMLNSCSEGITVVNIDNGFGAACAALRILRSRSRSGDGA